MKLYSKNGGPAAPLPIRDSTPDGSIYTDLENNPSSLVLLGYVETSAPQVVSRMQAKFALKNNGLLDAVDAAMVAAGGDALIYWEEASEFHRNHPMITAMTSTLGLTESQVDLLFAQAATVV